MDKETLESIRSWTPIINAIVVVASGIIFSTLQLRSAKRQTRMQLYDRRMKLFQATETLFQKIGEKGWPEREVVSQFFIETTQARFLFGEEIRAYLDEIFKKAIEVYTQQKQLYPEYGGTRAEGSAREAISNDQVELLKWFHAQSEVSAKRFGKYLSLH